MPANILSAVAVPDVNVSNDLTADCILVLGASVYSNDTPSPMLKDRLDMGIHLYNNSYVKKILVSGDHINKDYDEVNVMKKYLIDNNYDGITDKTGPWNFLKRYYEVCF